MMRRFIWSGVHFLYVHLAKPILFLFTPYKVHLTMMKFANRCGKLPFGCNFLKLIFKRRANAVLSQEIVGIEFQNPVGLAAGFDKNAEAVTVLSSIGFGFETIGSVTAKQCSGNPQPWFYRLPQARSIVVNAGLGNDGAITISSRLRRLPVRVTTNFPIFLSAAMTNSLEMKSESVAIKDYVSTLKRFSSVSAVKAVELNISCPNSFGGEAFTTPDKLEALLSAVDELKLNRPIFIKMPLGLKWGDFKKLLDVAVKHNIAGVTIANLLKDRSKLEKGLLPDSVKGNLSGKPTQALSDELVRLTYKNYGKKLVIIGVGGIFSAEDAYRKIRLGASLVEIITGMIFEGPQLAAQINDDLLQLLKRDGFENVSQAVGVDAKK